MKTAAMLGAAVLSFFGLGQSASSTPPSMPVNSCVNIERQLFVGSTGADVIALQKFLTVKPTGYFGPATKQKLIEWQMTHALIRTARAEGAGTTGPKTRSAMRCVPTVKSASTTNFVPSVVQPPVATITQASPSIIPVATPPASSGGGDAGDSNTQTQTSCPSLGSKPAASSCTTGPWITIQDEGDCSVWFCSDPGNDFQG